MSVLRTTAALGCALVLAASAVACGGDDKGKSSADPTVSSAVLQYRVDANKLCKPALKAIRKSVADVAVNSTDKKAKEAAFAKAGAGFLAEVAGLKKLAAPPEISDKVTTWLGHFTEAATAIKSNGLKLVEAGATPFKQADAEAADLKLDECRSSGS